MFKKLFERLGIFQCKHKNKILVGHSYATYCSESRYTDTIFYTVKTYRHFVCKKCNTHIKELITEYAPNEEKKDNERFEERLRSKGFLRTEDIMLKVDDVMYNKITIKPIDENKIF